MCKLLTLYKEDVEEIMPSPPRASLIELIHEKLALSKDLSRKHQREDIRCIAGIAGPTGIGKTTYMAALAVATTAYTGAKVTIVTPTKEARAEVLTRLLEVIANMIKRGEKPPKVLVLYSKIDTCVNTSPKIREIKQMLAEEEAKDEPDTNTINKLTKLFYARCAQLMRRGTCPFYENAKKEALVRKALAPVLENDLIYVVGTITEETRRIIEREAPTYMKLADEMGVELPYLADIRSIAAVNLICPYELAKALAKEVDIVVLDGVYLSAMFSVNQNPILQEAFSPDRVVFVDETHEIFRNVYPAIRIGEGSILYDRLESIRDMVPALAKIVDKYAVPEATLTESDARVRIAVPPDRLTDDEVRELMKHVKRAEREMRRLHLSRKAAVLIESEISVLKDALMLEKRGFRISEGARPGIIAFMEIKRGRRVEYYVIPVLLSRKLKPGRDFSDIIHFSATLLPVHLTLLHAIPSAIAGQYIATVKWGVIQENRRTAIVKAPAYISHREEVAALIQELIRVSGKDKVLVVATTTWAPLLKEIANELGYTYHAPRVVRTQREREREANRIRDMVHSPGKLLLHISPHTSFGVAVNLADKNRPLDALVIGASEAILPPSSEVNAEAAVLSRKYGINWWKAWFTVNVNRSILKVVQTAGRLQRSSKHCLDIVLIGRYFDRTLARFYEHVFGQYDVVYDDKEVVQDEIIEAVKEYMGW